MGIPSRSSQMRSQRLTIDDDDDLKWLEALNENFAPQLSPHERFGRHASPKSRNRSFSPHRNRSASPPAVRRVGGGFEYLPSKGAAENNMLMAMPPAFYHEAPAKSQELHRNLRASSPHRFEEGDIQILEDILRLAERTAHEDALNGRGQDSITLLRLLKAYDIVLRKNNLIPAEDTFYYRLLLKLSLDPDPDWWAKLEREAGKLNGGKSVSWGANQMQLLSPSRQQPLYSTSPRGRAPRAAGWTRSIAGPARAAQSSGLLANPLACWPILRPAGQSSGLLANPPACWPILWPAGGAVEPCPEGSRGEWEELATEARWLGCGAGSLRAGEVGRASSRLPSEPVRWGRGLLQAPLRADTKLGARSPTMNESANKYSQDHRLLSRCLRAWRQHSRALVAARVMREHAVENWMIAVSFWECRTLARCMYRWSARHKVFVIHALSTWADNCKLSCLRWWQRMASRMRWGSLASAAFFTDHCTTKAMIAWRLYITGLIYKTHDFAKAIAHWRGAEMDKVLAAWRKLCLEKVDVGLMRLELMAGHNARRYLKAWSRTARQESFIRRCEGNVDYQRQMGVKTRLWIKWRAEYKLRNKHHSILTRAAQRFRKRSLSSGFSGWLANTIGHRTASEKMYRCIRRLKQRRLYMALAQWRTRTLRSGTLMTAAHNVVQRMVHRSLGRGFYTWKGWLSRRADKYVVLSGAVNTIVNGAAIRCIRAWRETVGEFTQLRLLGLKTLSRLRNLTLYWVWNAWSVVVGHGKWQRGSLTKGLMRMTKGLLGRGWGGWDDFMKMRKYEYAIIARVAEMPARRFQEQAWGTWREAFGLRHKMYGAIKSIRCGCGSRALRQWKEVWQHAKWRRSTLMRAAQLLMKRGTARAMSSWRHWYRTLRHHRFILAPVIYRLKNRLLFGALQAMRANAANVRNTMMAIGRAGRHWQNRSMSAAYVQWENYAQVCSYQRVLLESGLRFLKHTLERKSLASWRDFVEHKVVLGDNLRRAGNLFFKRSSALAMASWREVLQDHSQKRDRLAKILVHMSMFGASIALATWRKFLSDCHHKAGQVDSSIRHWLSGSLGRCWGRWREYMAERATKYSKLRKAGGKWFLKNAAAAWQGWLERHMYYMELKLKLRRAAGSWQNRSLSGAFAAWQDGMGYVKETRALIKGAAKHLLRGRETRALEAWISVTDYKRQMADKMKRAGAFMLNREISKAFTSWDAFTQRQQKTRLAAMRLVRRTETAALAAWRAYLVQKAHLGGLLSKSMAHFINGALGAALQTWIESTKELKQEAKAGLRAAGHWLHGTAGRTFAWWQEVTSIRVVQKQKCVKVLSRLANRNLALAFDTLYENMSKQINSRKSLGFWTNQCSVQALNRWKEFKAESVDLRAKLEKGTRMWRGGALGRSFLWWSVETQRKATHARKCTYMLVRLINGTAARAFDTWRRETAAANWKQEVIERTFDFWVNSLQRKALQCWVSQVAHAERMMQGLERAVALWTNRIVGGSLHHWRDQAKHNADLYGRAHKVIGRMKNKLAAQVLELWRCTAAEQKELRGKMQAIMARWQRLELSYGMDGWKEYMGVSLDRKQRLSKAAAHWTMQHAVMALEAWYTLHSKWKVAGRRWLNAVMGSSFNTWCDMALTQNITKRKLEKAMGRWRDRLLFEAFNQLYWHWWETKSARKSLGMFTKNTSFRAMNQWKDFVVLSKARHGAARSPLHDMRPSGGAPISGLLRFERIAGNASKGAATAELYYKGMMYWWQAAAWRSFNKWQECTKRSVHRSGILEGAFVRMVNRLLAASWSTWREFYAVHSTLRLKGEAGVQRWQSSHEGRAFRQWQHFIYMRDLARQGAMLFIHNALMRSFRQWADFITEGFEMADKFEKAARAFFYRTVASGLRTWQASVVDAKWMRRRLKSVALHWSHTMMAYGWAGWVVNHEYCVEQKAKAKRAATFLTNYHAGLGFRAWLDFAERQVEAKARAKRAVMHALETALFKAFDKWAYHAEFEPLIRRASAFWTNGMLVGVLAAWKWNLTNSARRERMMRTVCLTYINRLLMVGWQTWLEAIVVAQERRRKTAVALGKLRNHHLVGPFSTWRETTDMNLDLQGKMLQIVQRMRLSLLSAATQQWRREAVHLRWQYEQAHTCIMKVMNRVATSALNTWQNAVVTAAENRAMTMRALNFFFKRTLILGWTQWLEQSVRQVAARESMYRALDLMLNIYRGKAWRTWHEVLRRRQVLQKSLGKIMLRELSYGMMGWMDLMQRKQQFADVRQMYRTRIMRRAFDSFLHRMFLIHVAKRGLYKMANQRVVVAWDTWRYWMKVCDTNLSMARDLMFRVVMRIKHELLHAALISLQHNMVVKHGLTRISARLMNLEVHRAFTQWSDFAWKSCRSKALLRRVLQGTRESFFLGWAETTMEEKEIKVLARELCARFEDRREDLVSQCVAIVAKWRNFDLWRVFYTWSYHATWDKRERIGALLAFEYHHGAVLRSALHRMRDAVQFTHKLERSAAFWAAGSAGRALQTWKDWTAQIHSMRGQLARSLVHWSHRLGLLMFGEWRCILIDKKRMKYQHAKSLYWWAKVLYQKAFFFWYHATRNAACYRRWEAACGTSLGKHKLRRVMREWLDLAIELRQLRLALESLYRRSVCNRLIEALEAWQDWVVLWKKHRHVMQALYCGRYLSHYFSMWKKALAFLHVYRRHKHTSLMHLVTKTCRTYFLCWRQLIAETNVLQSKMERIMQRWGNFNVSLAFSTLYWWKCTAQNRREALKRSMTRLVHFTAWQGLHGWRSAVLRTQELRDIIMQCVNRIRLKELSGAWEKWVGDTRAALSKGKKLDRAVNSWINASLQKAVRMMQSYTKSEVSKRHKMVTATIRMVNMCVRPCPCSSEPETPSGAPLRPDPDDALGLDFDLAEMPGIALCSAPKRFCVWHAGRTGTCGAVGETGAGRVVAAEGRFLSKAFRTMVEFTCQQVSRRRKLMQILSSKYIDQKRVALVEWRSWVRYLVESEAKVERNMNQMDLKILGEKWETWRTRVERCCKLRRVYNMCTRGMEMRALQRWLEHHEELKDLRADRHSMRKVLMRAFFIIASHKVDQKAKKAKMQRAGLLWMGGLRERAVRGWRRCAELMRKLRRLMGSVARGLLRKALTEWAYETRVCLMLKLNGEELASRGVLGFGHRMFQFWNKMMHASRHHRIRLVAWFLAHWRTSVGIASNRRRVLLYAVQRLKGRNLQNCWNGWRYLVHLIVTRRLRFIRKQQALKTALAIGEETLRRKRRNLLLTVLAVWRMCVVRERTMMKLMRRQLRGSMNWAFVQWREVVDFMVEFRAKMEVANAFRHETALLKYLQKWQDAVDLQKEDMLRKVELALEFAFGQYTSYALVRWRAFADHSRARRDVLRGALVKIYAWEMEAIVRKIFVSWRDEMRYRDREVGLIELADGHRMKRVAETCFLMWSSYTKAMRQPITEADFRHDPLWDGSDADWDSQSNISSNSSGEHFGTSHHRTRAPRTSITLPPGFLLAQPSVPPSMRMPDTPVSRLSSHAGEETESPAFSFSNLSQTSLDSTQVPESRGRRQEPPTAMARTERAPGSSQSQSSASREPSQERHSTASRPPPSSKTRNMATPKTALNVGAPPVLKSMRTLSPKRGRSRNLSPKRQERTRHLVQRMAIMSGNDEALLDSPKESLYAGLGKTSVRSSPRHLARTSA
ncbi:hypothetical protein CYMTET_40736 [Cymbomonas tetramitiformis]|uniref:Uncharacterized protein n=1 Tax=Cymbomonas tetramitiformis TaxID=36881 RepID=A0AAE0C8J8_9CHLO|nr:hypothetical protein CYMTET_40736 [Cymbomonas tetramitiformis]